MRGTGLVLAVLTLGLPTVAMAAPGLAETVSSPRSEKGVSEFEVRSGQLVGGSAGGRGATLIEYERGLSDSFRVSAFAEVAHDGSRSKVEALGLEGIFALGRIPGLGIDVGGYLALEQSVQGEGGVVEAKALFAKQAGPFEGRLNLIAETPLSQAGDLEFGYAAQATVTVVDDLGIGLQAFGDLGDSHGLGGRCRGYLGPMLQVETDSKALGGELEFQVGYLFPIGMARADNDGQFRLAIELERKF